MIKIIQVASNYIIYEGESYSEAIEAIDMHTLEGELADEIDDEYYEVAIEIDGKELNVSEMMEWY